MTPETTVATGALHCEYRGTKGPLFRIALRNAVLNLVTLGFYRFWGKTRVRRYVWSGLAPGGDPLEYTGNGLEKLQGFLMVVVVSAIYLGLSQVLLGFAGMSVFSGRAEDWTLQIRVAQWTLLAFVPLYFYARDRTRRYVLEHTRWRGIGFGVEPGVCGYVWRVMLHGFLTIISLGLLLPRQTFWLEKYRTDRTWYGAARFYQNGRWPMLYPAMKHIFIAVALLAPVAVLVAVTGVPAYGMFGIIGASWMVFGWVYYKTRSFEILAQHRTLAGSVEFAANPRAWRVIRIIAFGGLLTLLCLVVLMSAFSAIAIRFTGASSFADMINVGSTLEYDAVTIASLVSLALGYLVTFLFAGVLYLVFVRQPIVAHYVSTIRIKNANALHQIEQLSGDNFPETQGVADAMDFGISI